MNGRRYGLYYLPHNAGPPQRMTLRQREVL